MNITSDLILTCSSEALPMNSVETQDDGVSMTFIPHSVDEDDSGAPYNTKVEESESRVEDEEDGGRNQLDDDNEHLDPSEEHIIEQLLLSIGNAVTRRLDAIDTKLEGININTKYLEDKLDQVFQHFNPSETPFQVLPVQQSCYKRSNLQSFVKDIQIDQPEEYSNCFDSCYLGDEANEQMRVRAPLSSDELNSIESVCQTAEELADSLFDMLLDREPLDDLNEHSPTDLDNLLIHAIHLHLIHTFNISDDTWNRIQAKLLSKCHSTNDTRTCELADQTNAFNGQEFSVEFCPTSSSKKVFQMDEADLDLDDDDGVI